MVSTVGSNVAAVNVFEFTPMTPVIVANWSIEIVRPALGPLKNVPVTLPGSTFTVKVPSSLTEYLNVYVRLLVLPDANVPAVLPKSLCVTAPVPSPWKV
jgi:hypothetical protein